MMPDWERVNMSWPLLAARELGKLLHFRLAAFGCCSSAMYIFEN